MAIARVQYKAANGSGTGLAATWDSSTTANNLIVGVFTTESSVNTQPTVPGTYTVVSDLVSSLPHGVYSHVVSFYAENASSQSATGTFGGDNGLPKCLIVVEYSGIATSTALDKTASGTNSFSNSVATGTTATTAQADELLIGCFGNATSSTWSSPTNSFVIVAQTTDTSSLQQMAAITERIVSSTGTYQSGLTTAVAAAAYAEIMTFKMAAGGGGGSVPNGLLLMGVGG